MGAKTRRCLLWGKDTEVSLAIGVHVPHTPSPLVRWVPPLQSGAPSLKGQLSWSGVLPVKTSSEGGCAFRQA